MRTSRRCANPAQSQSRVARHGVHPALRYLENGAGAVIGTDPDLAAPGVQALLAHPVLLALLRATPRLEIFLARARLGLCAYPTRARAADSEVPSVALLGCYESLQDLPENLWAAPALGPVLAAHVTAPKRAESIAASLTPITPIDASSALVAAQYEPIPIRCGCASPSACRSRCRPPSRAAPIPSACGNIGGCRDLVFHVREASYDLPEIGARVAAAGLSVLAVEPPPRAVADPPEPTDLVGWDAREQAEPMLFGGMYHVWLAAS